MLTILVRSRVGLAVVAALTALLLLVPTTTATAPDPRVLAPNAPHHGKTYGQWAAAWWQWYAAQTTNNKLVCGPTGAGPVWFFDPSAPAPGQARTCTLPTTAPLFLPLHTIECSELERNGTTEAELRACANGRIDRVTTVEATLDGIAIADIRQYRTQTALFTLTLPENNRLGGPAASTPAVADGYWLLLAPLAPGTHTLTLHTAGTRADNTPFDLTSTIALTTTTTPSPPATGNGGNFPGLPNTGAGGASHSASLPLGLALALGVGIALCLRRARMRRVS
jgi:hypothetical protein